MKVITVTAAVKYSLDTGHGWKAIELGAEATLMDSDESWEQAQAELYQRLGQQLKTLWNNGKANGRDAPSTSLRPEGLSPEDLGQALEGHRIDVQPTQVSTPPSPHWCSTHGCEYQRFSRSGEVWYSHKAPDGKWCKEPK